MSIGKSVCFVLIGIFSLSSCFPIIVAETVPNSNEMVVATIGQPSTLDPGRAADTTTIGFMLNVYETLIFFDREKIDQFVPMLATEVPTLENGLISPDGLTYTFPIRSGVKFHNGDTLTAEDVEYSFEKLLVVDHGPMWLLYEPLLGLHGSRDDEGNIIVTAEQIDTAITHNGTHVTFHLAMPYPRTAFLQILSQWCSSILSKDWCIALGDWNGTWHDWQDYNQRPESPIDLQDTEPPGPHFNAMCGTGPYMFDYWSRDVEWSIVKFDDYWNGWPAPGSEGFVEKATIKFVWDWETRKNMFLAGVADTINVPRELIDEVLGQPGIRCIYPLPDLSVGAVFFTFNITDSSPYMGVPGGLPAGTFDESGIPPDFFSDIDVRKAFAYCLNYTRIIEEAWQGEAVQPSSPVIEGLPYHNPENPRYSLDLLKAEEHFRAAWTGEVWANGFNLTVAYNTGNVLRRLVCELFKENVESLNPMFHVNIQELDWGSEYFPQALASEHTLFIIRWGADFSDPHDFVFSFMHTRGDFVTFQKYSNSTIDALIEAGIIETDLDERRNIYYELQSLYYEDCPSVPLYQPRGRRFERDWVQGWYYNPLLSGNYFYTQWKESIPPAEVDPGSNVVDAVEASDTMILIETTASGNVSVSEHDINIEGTIPEDIVNVKCVVVDTTLDPSEIVFPIEIRIYFTNEEIISAYVDQSTLRMYYWDETSQEWILKPDSGVVTPSDIPGYDGYVWSNIYHLSVFAAMGKPKSPPPPEVAVGGFWVPINKFELLAPWITLASLLTVATASIVYVKCRKKQQD
jgi:peptide/nickel transport system substrate-binding protein